MIKIEHSTYLHKIENWNIRSQKTICLILKTLNHSQTTDFLIIGGGVIGLCLALEARKRHPQRSIHLIEKEPECGFHASGRNSGVLHAGFYYTADSLKARFTREGNRRWKEYCKKRQIPLNECGKLVVARDESELKGLDELFARGKKNEVPLEKISEKEAEKIEPRVKTYQQALFSPTTASLDPKEVVQSLVQDATKSNIHIHTSCAYLSRKENEIFTSKKKFSAGHVINSAGLYADKIAKDFGFAQNYQIIPFKGIYLYSDEPAGSLKTNIYPVPNLNNPFLGVHYTVTSHGKIKIGPTAIPAFWRENYQGVANFRLNELIEILSAETRLFVQNSFNFRNLAFTEIRKYFRKKMVQLASDLLKQVELKNYKKWGKPGIRAQLLDIKNQKLEMDFKFEGDQKSFHVLNAVSPAFTCAIPFSEYLWNQIENLHFNSINLS